MFRHADQGGPNLFLSVLVMFLIRVVQNERFNRFLWFWASLINNDEALRNCYLVSCRYKNLWDIDVYLKPYFYEKVSFYIYILENTF